MLRVSAPGAASPRVTDLGGAPARGEGPLAALVVVVVLLRLRPNAANPLTRSALACARPSALLGPACGLLRPVTCGHDLCLRERHAKLVLRTRRAVSAQPMVPGVAAGTREGRGVARWSAAPLSSSGHRRSAGASTHLCVSKVLERVVSLPVDHTVEVVGVCARALRLALVLLLLVKPRRGRVHVDASGTTRSRGGRCGEPVPALAVVVPLSALAFLLLLLVVVLVVRGV